MGYWLCSEGKTKAVCSLPHHENECLWTVHDFWSCMLCNLTGNGIQTSINAIMAVLRAKNYSDTLSPASWKWASLEHQRFLRIHLGWFKCHILVIIHICCPRSLFIWNSAWNMHYPTMSMCVNRAWTTVGLTHWVIKAFCGYMSL